MIDTDILQINNLWNVGIGGPDIFNAIASQSGGYGKVKFWMKDLHNQLGRQKQGRGSDVESALQYLRSMVVNDLMMFVRYTEDEEGRLQH